MLAHNLILDLLSFCKHFLSQHLLNRVHRLYIPLHFHLLIQNVRLLDGYYIEDEFDKFDEVPEEYHQNVAF